MAANASSSAATTTSKSNPSKKEKDTLIAVLQFLKKSKLSVSCRSTSSKRQTFFLKNADLLIGARGLESALATQGCIVAHRTKLNFYDW